MTFVSGPALRAIGLHGPLLDHVVAHLRDTVSSIPHPQPVDLLGGVPPAAAPRLARVTAVHRDRVDTDAGDGPFPARVAPALRAALTRDDDALAVGDWVLVGPDDAGDPWVVHRVPPLTVLARRQHDGNRLVRRVLVANVDTVLVVMGLDGDWNLRRLERFQALARGTGVDTVVVLTKADVAGPRLAGARLDAVRALMPGVPVVAVDPRGAEAREALAPWLVAGRTLVALGSSGTGKSTLTNTLAGMGDGLGGPPQATGGTRHGDDRGRHTTTARSLHRLAGGACLIDTPGVRTLRLDGDDETVAAGFDDVARLAPACRFRDCRHEAEPGCAVRDGVDPDRLRNFHKLLRESRRDSMTLLERQAEQARWRIRSKASRAAARRDAAADR